MNQELVNDSLMTTYCWQISREIILNSKSGINTPLSNVNPIKSKELFHTILVNPLKNVVIELKKMP